MRHPIALIALFVLCLGAGPCDMLMPEDETEGGEVPVGDAGCPDVTCTDELLVEIFRADNEAFLPGAYRVDIADGIGGAAFIECYYPFVGGGVDCDAGDRDQLGLYADERGMILWLQVLASPDQAAVAVSYGGAVIGQRTLTPMYEAVMDHASECETTCRHATTSLAVQSW